VRVVRRSLLWRIAITFFALSAIIVALLTGVAYAVIVREARASVDAQLHTLVAAKTRALESWLDESRRRLEFAATLDTVAESAASPEILRKTLEALRQRWPELGQLLFAATQGGLVIASTTRELEGQYRVHDTWFVRGLEGIFVQNVYPSPVTLQPTLTIAAPVVTSPGARVGVLAANLDLRVLDRIVGELSGPYPTTESYLVDRFSVFIFGDRYGREGFPRGVHSMGIDAAVGGASGSGLYRNYRGVRVIGVFRWLPIQELALLVEAPTADAFRAARHQTIAIAGTGLAVVALLAAGVLLLARRLAFPILAIEEAARKVTGGDLEARAPVLTQDEIGTLAGSFNDMTTHLGGLYATMQRNEERFRTLIEASSDVTMLVGRDGAISFVSPSVERHYGYAPAELLGTAALALVHPEDAGRVREAILERLVSSGEGGVLSIGYRLRDREGRWHTVDTIARNLLDHSAVGAILLCARDNTERHNLEVELAQAQKMEAVGRLAGGIAHDFNNLLTAIIGYAELLTGTPGLPAEAAEDAREITRAANRAAGLTQQLLAYSRKQVLQPRILNLNDLIAETETLLRRVIGEHVVIHTDLDPRLLPVEADPGQLQRVIVNLSVNSRDAMPDGGDLTIATRNVFLDGSHADAPTRLAPGPYVLLEVNDTGVGMDENTMARLFEPFFTTKDIGKGTGLGLATVYGIVRQSGGSVTARSSPGQGTTFRIHLPPAPVAPSGLDAVTEPVGGVGGNELILLVEDEPAVGKLMHEALSRAGYRVLSTGDPREAVGMAERAGNVDLLVTDVVMPGMDGGRLAELLRASHPGIRVLFVSGYTANASVSLGASSDKLSFLQKPFTPSALARRVRDVLDRS
jgi:hypothetical protein